jgi:phosphonate transport system permease protein
MWPLLDFHKKNVLTGLMFVVFIGSLFFVDWGPELIHPGGGTSLWQMIKGMFTPDLSWDILGLALMASWQTLVYAVTGMTLALMIAFLFGVLASGVLAQGRWGRPVLKTFFRGLLGFMRAIHELVWAWLFVAAFGLTPFAAVFAIAIPYGGILGRIFADMLSDVPPQPI